MARAEFFKANPLGKRTFAMSVKETDGLKYKPPKQPPLKSMSRVNNVQKLLFQDDADFQDSDDGEDVNMKEPNGNGRKNQKLN